MHYNGPHGKRIFLKTAVKSQMQKTNVWSPGAGEGGTNWETETDINTILYIK